MVVEKYEGGRIPFQLSGCLSQSRKPPSDREARGVHPE